MEITEDQNASHTTSTRIKTKDKQKRTSTRSNTQKDQQEVQHNDIIMQNSIACKLSKEHYSNITGSCVTQLLGNLVPVCAWIFKLCGGMARCRRNRRSKDGVRKEITEGQNAKSRTSTRTNTRIRGHFPNPSRLREGGHPMQ